MKCNSEKQMRRWAEDSVIPGLATDADAAASTVVSE